MWMIIDFCYRIIHILLLIWQSVMWTEDGMLNWSKFDKTLLINREKTTENAFLIGGKRAKYYTTKKSAKPFLERTRQGMRLRQAKEKPTLPSLEYHRYFFLLRSVKKIGNIRLNVLKMQSSTVNLDLPDLFSKWIIKLRAPRKVFPIWVGV